MEKVAKKRKLKIYEVDQNNDIKFKGPLSYRHFKIMGWIALILGQIGLIMVLYSGTSGIEGLAIAGSIFKFFNNLMAPLLLLAVFAQVLTAQNGYKKLLLVYAAGSIGFYLAFLILYEHFLVGVVSTMSQDIQQAHTLIDYIIHTLNQNGFLAFNIFIDLLLCCLVTFFLNYHPVKYFQGKKVYIFRSLAALPILYELGSITIKILASTIGLTVSPFVFPLLTTKPPMSFVVFIAAAVFIKLRERHYLKHGKSYEDYQKFLDTNTNTFQVARFLVFAIIVAVIIDFVLIVTISVAKIPSNITSETDVLEALNISVKEVYSWGIGASLPMILIIPAVIFFNYRKTYKNKMIDIIIPLAGVAAVAIVYVEGMFQVLLAIIRNKMNSGDSQEELEETTQIIIQGINKIINVFRK